MGALAREVRQIPLLGGAGHGEQRWAEIAARKGVALRPSNRATEVSSSSFFNDEQPDVSSQPWSIEHSGTGRRYRRIAKHAYCLAYPDASCFFVANKTKGSWRYVTRFARTNKWQLGPSPPLHVDASTCRSACRPGQARTMMSWHGIYLSSWSSVAWRQGQEEFLLHHCQGHSGLVVDRFKNFYRTISSPQLFTGERLYRHLHIRYL